MGKIAVIGAGIMGTATAAHFARRGQKGRISSGKDERADN